MSDPTYKYFDNADTFLANLMEFFPSIYGTITDNKLDMEIKDLMLPTISKSAEFCTSIQNGIINTRITGQGGFGTVGDFQITEDQENQKVYAIIVSIKPTGGLEPFYVPVVIKTGHQDKQITLNASVIFNLPITEFPHSSGVQRNIKIIAISDPITEIVFGSMLGHLYDLGLCPFYAKYFSAYICDANPDISTFSISFVIEKSSITMHDFLELDPYIREIRQDPNILINIIFQYIYAVYIGKMYIGFTHFDAHLANVMITRTSNKIIADVIRPSIPYIYQGKQLEAKDYILINMGYQHNGQNAWLAMKYNGLMVKMIDFGGCAAYLYAAKYSKYKKDFSIKTSGIPFVDLAYDICKDSSQRRNTWEIQFFLSCMHQSLYNGSGQGTPPNIPLRTENQPIIEVLNDFTEHFYNSPTYRIGTYLDKNPNMQAIDHTTGLKKVFPNRSIEIDIPAFSDPKELLRGLARYCQTLGHFIPDREIINGSPIGTLFYLETDIAGSKFTFENSLIFNDEPMANIKNLNNLDKFIKNVRNIETGCYGRRITNEIFAHNDEARRIAGQSIDHSDSTRSRLCANSLKELEKWHPHNTMSSSLVSPLINNTYYNRLTGTFNRNIVLSRTNFPKQLQAIDNAENLSIFKMQINPKALRMSPNVPGALFYHNYQNWLDYNPLRTDMDGKEIETVRLNIIVVDPKGEYNVDLNSFTDLWDATTSTNTCFSINGGYYTVSENVNDLTSHLINQKCVNEQRPIGFCFNENVTDGTNGTYLPIPKPYRSHFGVIWCEHNNVLHIDTHNDFMALHETVIEPIGYLLDNGNIYTTDQPVIRMNNSKSAGARGTTPVMRPGNHRNYKWAFCSGVLLVYNRTVVFDLDIMLNSQFYVVENDTPTISRVPAISARMVATPNKPPNFTKYKLLQQSQNNYKFKSSSQNDIFDSYGVKMSNRYAIHNVMGITTTGKVMFFLVEGRGFNGVGLDRVQVAYLVDKFDIEKAISLDGGFSANAVYKMDDGTKRYVQNDPQKRRLGTSMTFRFDQQGDMQAPEKIGHTGL